MNELWERSNKILGLLQPSNVDLSKAKRFGSEFDGGYVIIDDLSKSDFLISMGVADDVNFEKFLSSRIFGVHLYDDSIDALPEVLVNSEFFHERIGGNNYTTIESAMCRAPSDFDLLLKIDIEGSEWEALAQADSNVLNKFRQIVVEFHWFENIQSGDFFNQAVEVLEKLSKTHLILNSHPNNWGDILIFENLVLPQVIEVTYLRRENYCLLSAEADPGLILERLNRPCNNKFPEIYLMKPVLDVKQNLQTSSVGAFQFRKSVELTQQRDELTQQRDELTQQRDELTQQRDELTQQRDEIVNSTIWKLTNPLRRAVDLFKR
jgi:hypothetical protein